MSITLRNLALLLVALLAVVALPGIVWWYLSDTTNVEPIAAFVGALIVLIPSLIRIDWRELIETGKDHDIALFAQADSLLPEDTIQFIVNQVTGTHLRHDSELRACDSFHDFCSRTSNAYISKILEAKKQSFNRALDELGKYTSTHFFHVSPEVYRLYPDLMGRLEDGDPETAKRYFSYNEKLQKLAGAMLASYEDYRSSVKQKLKK
jgi:hypothetical protein